MKRRNTPAKPKNDRVKRQRDPLPWRYCLLTLVCGLILVGGFFYAARQHFSAMDYGIKNAKLRQQKEELEAEQRRLYLSREISLSPAEIKKAAKKIGLHEYASSSIEAVSRRVESVNPLAEKKFADKPGAQQQKTQPLTTATKAEKKEERSRSDKPSKTEKEGKSKEQTTNTSGGDVRPRVAAKK